MDRSLEELSKREEVLSTIPAGDPLETIHLFEHALYQLKDRSKAFSTPPIKMLLRLPPSDYYYALIGLPQDVIESVIEELRHPFGPESPASTLAKALFRFTAYDINVAITWSNSIFNMFRFFRPPLRLSKNQLQIPDKLRRVKGRGFHVELKYREPLPESHCKGHFCEHAYSLIGRCEKHSVTANVGQGVYGFFQHRTRPFIALRTYATHPPEIEASETFEIEIADSYYRSLDSRTLFLKRVPKRFDHSLINALFPPAPTLAHHHLDSDFTGAPQKYHATFVIGSSDRPAHIHFVSEHGVSAALPVTGPPGLHGLVWWPGLTRDIWQTRIIEDDQYQQAMEWVTAQIEATTRVLDSLRADITQLLEASDLFVDRHRYDLQLAMRNFWSSSSGRLDNSG